MSHTYDARTSAMPRSLALSSLSYLTLVVLLLLVRALLPAGPPSLVVVDAPPPLDNVITSYAPEVPGGTVHPLVAPAQPGPIVPVDPHDAPVQTTFLTPDTVPLSAYTGNQVGDHAGPSTGGVGGTAVATDDPKLDEFVYTDTMPELVHVVMPEYPPIAQQAGMEGTVKMRLLVGKDGRVRKVHIEHPGSLFDPAATTAGLQFVFTPATASGHPVSVWVAQDIRFTLR